MLQADEKERAGARLQLDGLPGSRWGDETHQETWYQLQGDGGFQPQKISDAQSLHLWLSKTILLTSLPFQVSSSWKTFCFNSVSTKALIERWKEKQVFLFELHPKIITIVMHTWCINFQLLVGRDTDRRSYWSASSKNAQFVLRLVRTVQAEGRINSEKHQVIPEWIFYIENNNKVSGGRGVMLSLQRITTERAEAAREIKRILWCL